MQTNGRLSYRIVLRKTRLQRCREKKAQQAPQSLAGYSIVELEDLVHAYAITIHKSQGSEFDAVIIPILGGNPMLYNKNLLYTAVTRAKKMVVLIGKKSNIYHMIKNNYMVTRNTLLKRFLLENNTIL